VFPKRCGHLSGKDVVDADKFTIALHAALEARQDSDTIIVARTDARAPLGIDEAIRRAKLYASTGADVIFVEAPQSVEEIEQIAAEVDAALLLNVVPGGLTPELEHARLAELGYRVAIHPGVALAAVVPAAIEALSGLREHTPSLAGGAGPTGFFDLFGLSAWNELGDRYRANDN
jgi:2-methylisocitrate lyase-like PEP mutase family enzyme